MNAGDWLTWFVGLFLALAVLAAILTALPRLGRAGRGVADGLARVPALDVVVAMLSWIPWVAAGVAAGWRGLLASIAAQILVLTLWVVVHEAMHRREVRGPRIVKALNRIVGPWRNHAALWVSLLALPVFWAIRLSEILIYPLLRLLLGFPRLRHGQWVTVSRHKFDGLVGHDLIWCLYCDWMTGIYALGAEMLRVVESFWCPIQFIDPSKCEKCRIDFPDIDTGWIPPTGTMGDVEATLERMYASGRREWFSHPARLSVSAPKADRETPESDPADAPSGDDDADQPDSR